MMKRAATVLALVCGASLFWGCAADVAEGGGEDQLQADVCWADFGPEAPGECMIGEERECTEYDPNSPVMFCRDKCVNVDGKAVWGLRTYDFQCPFYESKYHIGTSNECTCNTPLVLSFDNGAVEFTAQEGAAFDLTRDGVCHASDWPTAATPWLALDRDNDGVIDDGGELFGSATRLANGSFAKNGFEALRDLDADHNDVFDARDPAFANVVIWSDTNLDRQSDSREMTSLEAAGVRAIDLHDARDMRCDARGNCEGERSKFVFEDATGKTRSGTVIDVYLATR